MLCFPLKRRFPFACYFRGIFVLSGFCLLLDTFIVFYIISSLRG
nr:MAG TPA: hypothetical protein [Caudoviricetes sp.]